MTRGFIKSVGNPPRTRMRFVKPGFNADDFGTPPEAVIFDSDDIGTLSVLATGEYDTGTGFGGTQDGIIRQIVSWNMPYVPLCFFQLNQYAENPSNNRGFSNAAVALTGDYGSPSMSVYQTGIVLKMRALSINFGYIIRYTAFRMPAR